MVVEAQRRQVDRSTDRGRLLLIGTTSTAAFVVGLVLAKRSPAGADTWVRAATHEYSGGPLELVMKGFALLSGVRVSFVVAALVGAYFAIAHRDWRPGVTLMVALIGVALAADSLKEVFDRPSPEEWAVGQPSGSAFPSGHAAVAVTTWGLIGCLAARRLQHPLSTLIALASVLVLLGTMLSRILLGDHWASDVLAGIGLGGVWFCLAAESHRAACSPTRARRSASAVEPRSRRSLDVG